jgi:hypothetical protein
VEYERFYLEKHGVSDVDVPLPIVITPPTSTSTLPPTSTSTLPLTSTPTQFSPQPIPNIVFFFDPALTKPISIKEVTIPYWKTNSPTWGSLTFSRTSGVEKTVTLVRYNAGAVLVPLYGTVLSVDDALKQNREGKKHTLKLEIDNQPIYVRIPEKDPIFKPYRLVTTTNKRPNANVEIRVKSSKNNKMNLHIGITTRIPIVDRTELILYVNSDTFLYDYEQ